MDRELTHISSPTHRTQVDIQRERVVSFIEQITARKSNKGLQNAISTLASVDSLDFYEEFLRDEDTPSVMLSISDFVGKNGGFCFDIGCGYMQVGRQVAKYLDIDYIGVDIIDHPNGNVFQYNPQVPPLGDREHFIHMDFFRDAGKIPDSSTPFLLLNSFDPSTYLVSNEFGVGTSYHREADKSKLLANISRILMPGGYIMVLGGTTGLRVPEWIEKLCEYSPYLLANPYRDSSRLRGEPKTGRLILKKQ